ncbi:Neuropilin and tolloid-like protein 1 [Toxocara canis]|uniref:Neuropilin and tolloid-like protein 1 n=1 Tax=Toxocara canis TaxID=6265 RepID=A0A0B2V652_TOXCA|nr:Neuropilin and tolloid-like protein 1 [Toxocara canis]
MAATGTDSIPISSLDVNDACQEFHAGGLAGMNEFASPGYPHNYPPGRDCVRIIEAPLGHDILIHFRHVFQIESTYEESRLKGSPSNAFHCPNDFIEIRDGRYGFSPLIGRFCGMQIPRGEIRAKSGTAWLRFYSDEVLEYKGFYADYEFVRSQSRTRSTTECNIVLSSSLDGHIDSKSLQDFYQNYGNASDSVDCVWRVEVPQSLHIALFVENFTLGAPNMCDVNFLEVYSGHTSDSPMRRFCGISASQTFTVHSTVFVRIYARSSVLADLHTRILFTAYSRQKNCSAVGLFSCGDDTCIPASLVCNTNINCLYKSDEQQCNSANETIADFFATGYSRLLVIVFMMFIATVLLCLWSLTHCSCLKSHRTRSGYEVMHAEKCNTNYEKIVAVISSGGEDSDTMVTRFNPMKTTFEEGRDSGHNMLFRKRQPPLIHWQAELSSMTPPRTISGLAASNLSKGDLSTEQNGECRSTLTTDERDRLRNMRSVSQPVEGIFWSSDITQEENTSIPEGTTFASLLSRLGIQKTRCTTTPVNLHGSFLIVGSDETRSALDDSGVWRKRFSRSDTEHPDDDSTSNWLTASDLAFPLDRRRSSSRSPIPVHIRD